ncbi:type III pantothenate kinase [Desulfococcus multivorans]|jgi:type III pantothenate kinase|uniref:Type III pantothenate kinase n=2 Tax=Desulfococcus TaxID=896 RepID=S7TGY2_DESML|nr:type III pantothenate kinase [Desulfococcus multivorans]AOY60078.1 CoaX: type III pantothenate kinase [Desulfococcus multivorans]AQV02217.1 type III pantothenate kinase [Desulfococcus multivorans]EPR36071.1 putative transcriptional acitvator, Baf family [Desulfococcus multivorans DSM 2059]MDX9819854.1 type III pantothenate kinase [Desulfococcus multivorans]SJZ37929.1 pantothenate kinase [Desulfococcus multivorans DSM 2059]
MLLVIDVGNTNTVMGIYHGKTLVRDWRIRTERNTTEDEFNFLVSGLFARDGIDAGQVKGTIISSVVPPMVNILDAFCRKYMKHAPVWVDARTAAGMPILYGDPSEVGADRIVNAVGAYARYPESLIIIDFGTATTFDAVSEKGEYLGGAISPGIRIASEALFMRASKLPRVEIFSPPDRVIGKNTVGSIQAGIIFGYAGLVDGMVRRMAEEMGTAPRVVATGGLAPLMAGVSETIDVVDGNLTLEGLRIIHERQLQAATGR